MSRYSIRRFVTTAAVASTLLVAGLAVAAVANAQSTGSLADAQAQFEHPQLAWDTATCPGAPISYANNVLVGIDLTQEEIMAVETTLEDHNTYDYQTQAAFNTTVFHLASDSATEMRTVIGESDLSIELELDHVFFYDPHWRFSPHERPTSTTRTTSDTAAFDPFGEADRPIVVIDTGYPHGIEGPQGYQLNDGARTVVDPTSPTAFHGPFIASQIAALVPTADIFLQRMLTERGGLINPQLGAEVIFDEVALIETLHAANLGNLDNPIVNLSFGTSGCEGSEPRLLEAALEQLGDLDVVAAAGNDQTEALQYPASFGGSLGHRVHSVGAHDGHLFGPTRACFSNYGGVEVWAPGTGVLGRIPDGGSGILAEASGTSFAAPYVSAALSADVDIYSNVYPFRSRIENPSTSPVCP